MVVEDVLAGPRRNELTYLDRASDAARLRLMASRFWATARALPSSSHDLDGKLVISLTSHPGRFPTLHLTLRCLLTQSVRPDQVILWVGEGALGQLPPEVTSLRRFGLEIRARKDLRSYTKIIYALRELHGAWLVTADDDLFYGRHWLRDLLHAQEGDAIICHRAHLPGERGGAMTPYDQWEMDIQRASSSPWLFPTGVGGVLYPPASLHSDVTDEATFTTICPQADDVWLYFMGQRAGSTYRLTPKRFRIIHWAGSQAVNLWQDNVVGSANTVQIRAMEQRFGLLGTLRPA